MTEIDTLGELLAEIAALNKRADKIKEALKDRANLSGEKSFEGDLFKATYIESNRSVVDWKAIAKEAGIPAELIAKHTGTTAVFSIKVASR